MSAGRWLVTMATVAYLGVMLGYEAWALWTKNDVTISRMVWTLVSGRPGLAAAMCLGLMGTFGFLMGHFFWQAKQ